MEIGGLAAIDIDNHIAFHLEAVQTLNTDEQSLTTWYAGIISARKDTLTAISKYMVADAWFSKKSFVDQIVSMDMHLISRLRDDAGLRYISKEKSTGKKGRPRKYSGKIIFNDIDKDYFTFISQDEESTVYSAEVYSKALKRTIKLVHVTYRNAKGKETCKLYFSTDVSMPAADVLLYYIAVSRSNSSTVMGNKIPGSTIHRHEVKINCTSSLMPL